MGSPAWSRPRASSLRHRTNSSKTPPSYRRHRKHGQRKKYSRNERYRRAFGSQALLSPCRLGTAYEPGDAWLEGSWRYWRDSSLEFSADVTDLEGRTCVSHG